jgi:hypothetical protein
MVMSELTGGVDGAGLLVFLGCSMKGRYIDPDQQGDKPTNLFLYFSFSKGLIAISKMIIYINNLTSIS